MHRQFKKERQKMNSCKVKCHMDGKQRTKAIKAAPRGALTKLKRAFGIKAISKAAKPIGRKACFDGCTMCYLDGALADGTSCTH